jgi:hypothetical protein
VHRNPFTTRSCTLPSTHCLFLSASSSGHVALLLPPGSLKWCAPLPDHSPTPRAFHLRLSSSPSFVLHFIEPCLVPSDRGLWPVSESPNSVIHQGTLHWRLQAFGKCSALWPTTHVTFGSAQYYYPNAATPYSEF